MNYTPITHRYCSSIALLTPELTKRGIITVMKQLHVATPYCLIVTGLPGSGKTTFSRAFADTFQAPYLDCPAIRSFVSDEFPAENLVDELVKQVMRSKVTMVVETSEGSRVERQELTKQAKANGYIPLVVWVQVEPSIAKRRSTVSTRTHVALHDNESFVRAARKFTPPNDTEPTVVVSGMHTQASQLRVVLKRISQQSGRDRVPVAPPIRTERSTIQNQRSIQ